MPSYGGLSLAITILMWLLGLGLVLMLGRRLALRLQLSRAKHPSLAGHVRWGRRLARLIPYYEYDETQFFRADDAPEEVAEQRQAAFRRLAALYAQRFANTVRQTNEVQDEISDLQFTARYRVPFQFSRLVRRHLSSGAFVVSSSGPVTTDLDGNQRYDLTGSYGVNVFGYDFYKECIERGSARVRDLGPVLGSYHPVTAGNVHRLRAISRMDEVSFHMSGTEAVMQAVRLARYHTRRRYLVRFAGSYHGWWGEVQPGVGNPVTERDTLTLKDMSERTLRVLRSRDRTGAYLISLCVGTALFGMFFFLTLFVQDVWGYSPLKAGLAFLPMVATIMASSGIASQLVARVGARPLMITGAAATSGGMYWFSHISVHTTYVSGLLGPSRPLA